MFHGMARSLTSLSSRHRYDRMYNVWKVLHAMAFCSHCQREFETVAGQSFCDECGGQLSTNTGKTDVSSNEDIAVQSTIDQGSSPPIGPSDQLMQHLPSTDIDPSDGRIQQVASSQKVDIGDKVTNVYNQITPQDYCAYGGEKVQPDYSFRCPTCGREPLCVDHYDKVRRICAFCLKTQLTSCAVCGGGFQTDETESCQRCHKTVCADDWDVDRNWCSTCSASWKDVVSAMEAGDVVISMGTVVGTDELQINDNALMTQDGRPVATIKENTWYSSVKQWHRVKQQLLVRERQAMRRFYPSMQLDVDDQGSASWSGEVTTWSGKRYDVLLRYPPSFPYRPPAAYVTRPRIKESRHIYPDGHLCLFHKDDKAWQVNTTAATVMSWVSLWLHCYEVWLESGNWPRPEADQMVISPKY